MTPLQAAKILKDHNEWRRSKDDEPRPIPHSPKKNR